jgi:hypothetical protein
MGVVYSHSGLVPGFTSSLTYLPSRGMHVVTASNTQAEHAYNDIVGDQIDRVLRGLAAK